MLRLRDCTLPRPHAAFLDRALPVLAADPRVVGVAAGGSLVSGAIDEWSDLDFVIAVEPEHYGPVAAARREIAARLGPLLGAFTGEHVGEPRLLICLYGPPALHVDLKFVKVEDAAVRVEDPHVLWERDGRLSAALAADEARYPTPELSWIEERFWIWVHYVASKVGRGELFEALDGLAFLRVRALGPLALQARGARPSGVRRIETAAPDLAASLRATVAVYDARSCLAALRAAVEVYRELRAELADDSVRSAELAEAAAIEYLREVERRIEAPR